MEYKLNALLCTLRHMKYFTVTVNFVYPGLAFLSVSDCQAWCMDEDRNRSQIRNAFLNHLRQALHRPSSPQKHYCHKWCSSCTAHRNKGKTLHCSPECVLCPWVSTSVSLLNSSTWKCDPDIVNMLCDPLTAYVNGDLHTAERNHQSSTAVAATEHPI